MPRTDVRPFRIFFTAIGAGAEDYPRRWADYRHRMLSSLHERDPQSADRPDRSVPVRTQLPDGATGVLWRLRTGSHREVAGSARLFRDAAAARADALEWVAHCERLVVQRVMTSTLDRFTWFATVDSEPVILAHRWYPTRRDRNAAVRVVLAHLPGALVTTYLQESVVPGHSGDAGSLPMLEADLDDRGPIVRERLHAQRLRELRRDRGTAPPD